MYPGKAIQCERDKKPSERESSTQGRMLATEAEEHNSHHEGYHHRQRQQWLLTGVWVRSRIDPPS